MKQIANAFYAFTAQLYAQGYANSQPVARRTADWVKSEQPRTWTETTTNALELSRSTRSTYSMHKWRLVKQQSEVKKVHKKISYLQENHDATFSTVIACCAETGSKRTANAENCSPRGAEKSGAGTVPLRYCPMRRFAGKPAFLKGEKKNLFRLRPTTSALDFDWLCQFYCIGMVFFNIVTKRKFLHWLDALCSVVAIVHFLWGDFQSPSVFNRTVMNR